MCADFLRRAGQRFQVGERSSIFETAEFSVTNAALGPLGSVNYENPLVFQVTTL